MKCGFFYSTSSVGADCGLFSFYLYDSDSFQPDPNGILSFLIAELQAAEDAGQRAWVVGHMQPGGEDTLRDQVSLVGISSAKFS